MFTIRNAAVSGNRGQKRRRRGGHGWTRRQLGSGFRLGKIEGEGRLRLWLDLRADRVRGSAAEPGVAGPVQDGDYPFEFGDGEVGDFSAVKGLGAGLM